MNICYLIILSAFSFVASTSMHTHKRTGQKEREEDGAFVHRDANHYNKEGKHNEHFDHEAILGSRTTADEFDTLPPHIAKEKLKDLAIMMDKDMDGFINKEELRKWVMKSFSLLSKEEADEKFEEEDDNMDGKVSWDEHVKEVYSYIDENEATTDDEQQKLKNEDKLLFEAADRNHDGLLDPTEFVSFNSPEEHKQMFDVLYTRSMFEKDQDKDGFLQVDEFIGEYGHSNQEQYLIEKRRFEDDYDVNHDGKLDKEEVLKWLIPDNSEIADEEVEHLFGEADEDHNGKLSIKEIVDNHEVFVGSEATDFGEHLHDTEKFIHEEL